MPSSPEPDPSAEASWSATTRARLPGLVIGLIFGLTGVYLLAASIGFDEAIGRSDPGPAFVPRIAGSGLVIGSVWHLIRLPRPGADAGYPALPGVARIFAVLAAVGAFAIVVRPLGFILTTMMFLLATLLLAHVRRLVPLIGIPVIASFGLYLVFARLLDVSLPRAVLERLLYG